MRKDEALGYIETQIDIIRDECTADSEDLPKTHKIIVSLDYNGKVDKIEVLSFVRSYADPIFMGDEDKDNE